jgi:transcription elongation factor GreA
MDDTSRSHGTSGTRGGEFDKLFDRQAGLMRRRAMLVGCGEPGDSAEYDAVERELAVVAARLSDLRRLRATPLDGGSAGGGGVIGAGSGVHVYETGSGTRKHYLIGESFSADALGGTIAIDSPLGVALIGRRKGEVVRVRAPIGVREYRIVAVE